MKWFLSKRVIPHGLVGLGALALLAALFGLSLAHRPMPRQPERIALWDGEGTDEASQAYIMVYRPAKENGCAVIICPGGGYGALVLESEGTQIARWLAQRGIVGVVLEYRLPNGQPEIPLLDAQRAIRLVRAKADEWGCHPNRIGILGFSAGGHLAATASTRFDAGDPHAQDAIARESSRPDFSILIYPVITMGPHTDRGTRQTLLGPEPDPETVEMYSCEKWVTKETPPALLIHALDDSVVSPVNSELYVQALRSRQIPVEYLEWPTGGHGLGYGGPRRKQWQNEVLRWLGTQKMIPGGTGRSPFAK